jgi:Homing endonuclease associated repeat
MSVRLERAQEAARLRAQGLLGREIAERMGVSRTYAHELLADPTGAASRARKDSYRGTCVDCGGPTSGGDGPSKTPARCAACAARHQHENRRWTREAIIEAIQLLATENGRPPLASEWLRERDPRFPAPSIIYRSKGNPYPPFASWADAIEAAGFPKPHVGHKVMSYGQGRNHMPRIYVVLCRNGDGHWKEQRVEGFSPERAIEKVADGPGEYVAILERLWVAHKVAPVTTYAVVK